MFTYRTGAAGAVAAAVAFAEHLREQTLPAEAADLARYYQRGPELSGPNFDPLTRMFAIAVARGAMGMDEAVESLAWHRLNGPASTPPPLVGEREERVIATFAWMIATGVMDDMAALDALLYADRERAPDRESWDWREVEERLSDKLWRATRLADEREAEADVARHQKLRAELGRAVAWEKVAGDKNCTLADPRFDMDPRYATLMGIDPLRPVLKDELANLLSGRRADGEGIPGKQIQSSTRSVAEILGLSTERVISAEEIANVLVGRRPNGNPMDATDERAARKLLRLLGVRNSREGVTDAEKQNLLSGMRANGARLVEATYLRQIEATKVAISFIDCCFSADKSVSLAWAFAPTEAERNIILRCHREAVDRAMAHVADVLGQAARGKAARNGRETGMVGWVRFDHFAARPTVKQPRVDPVTGEEYTDLRTLKVRGDPLLHTHVAMPNVVLTESGRIGALDLQGLDGRVKEFGGYYQACLATLLREAGIGVNVDPVTGAAVIPSIPDHVRDEFSKRTKDAIGAARSYAAEHGLVWDNLTPEQQASLLKGGAVESRKSKSDDVGDFESWRVQAKALGWRHASVLDTNTLPRLDRLQRLDLAWEASQGFADKALMRRAVIEGADAREIATRGLVASGTAGPEDIDALTRAFREYGVKQNGQWTSLIWGTEQVKGRERIVITTALHEAQERELIGLIQEARADTSAALTPGQIAAAVEGFPELDFTGTHGEGQRAGMEKLGLGGRFELFIGAAGSGKSTVLRPLVDAWQREGREVYGISLAWKQADNLASAGIGEGRRVNGRNRAAVQPFIDRVNRGFYKLDHNSVVVVDEFGLLGTRPLLDLMRLQAKLGFKLVALGDDRQCQSIEAGPVIALAQRALGADSIPSLLTTIRQETERERTISGLFREGRAAEALAMKHEDGTLIVQSGDYAQAVERIGRLWQDRHAANSDNPGFKLTVSVPTNEDARNIAAAIRAVRREAGEIGPDRAKLDATDLSGENRYVMPVAVGDRVRLYASTTASFGPGMPSGNIGRNASVLTVEGVSEAGITMRNHKGNVGFVAWETLRHPENGRIRLGYGDVLTIDSSQSDTVTEHIHAMPGGTRHVTGFKAYVAESRHRRIVWLVTSDGAERQEIVNRRPLGDQRLVTAKDVRENMARNLSRQPEKVSALAMLDRVRAVRRESARMMQASFANAERQRAEQRGRAVRDRLSLRRQDVAAAAARQSAMRAAEVQEHGRRKSQRL